jgi:hypothetical protein
LTSPRGRAEPVLLDELEQLLGAVEAELQGLRTRPAPSKGTGDRESRQRIEQLELENRLLARLIAAAKEMVHRLQTRLRFIEDRGESS